MLQVISDTKINLDKYMLKLVSTVPTDGLALIYLS